MSSSAHTASVPLARLRIPVAVALCVIVIGGVTFALTRPHQIAPPLRAPNTIVRPLRITSITPPVGATNVAFGTAITIHFSEPLASSWKPPTLVPPTRGAWNLVGAKTLEFRPDGNYVPSETVHVAVPPGDLGVQSVDGAKLTAAYSSSFTVAAASMTRLQQLLAELNYLPVAFVPQGDTTPVAPTGVPGVTTNANSESAGNSGASGANTNTAATTIARDDLATSTDALDSEATTPTQISLSPVPGTFEWRFTNVPSQLSSLWSPGADDVVTQGAVMAFESEHGLAPDGEPGPAVWTALLNAVAARQVTTRPYDYLMVTETLPESLFVWSDGQIIYSTLANTGVSGASTPLGTWPVYLRFTSTTMTGTNPDGTHYSDPDIPWVSYFHGNDAVHGFVRASYGFPQSDGCVEIPIAHAASVYPLDPYGTLVTVTTGDLAAELNTPVPSPYYSYIAPTTTTSTTTAHTTSTTTPSR